MKHVLHRAKVTTPHDAHRMLVLQVYLGLNSVLYIGEIFISRLRSMFYIVSSEFVFVYVLIILKSMSCYPTAKYDSHSKIAPAADE